MSDDIEKIFTEKYVKNSWLGTESRSGPGSSLNKNLKLLDSLEKFVKIFNVKTILDIGCGDFNWMKHFNFKLIDHYVGVDIVKQLVDFNNNQNHDKKIEFRCSNIIEDSIEKVDLILCKDVLCHLSYEDTLVVLTNIKKSNSLWLASTTFPDYVNKNIKTGAWRPINLEVQPFSMGYPNTLWENIEDKKEGWTSKSIGIWKL